MVSDVEKLVFKSSPARSRPPAASNDAKHRILSYGRYGPRRVYQRLKSRCYTQEDGSVCISFPFWDEATVLQPCMIRTVPLFLLLLFSWYIFFDIHDLIYTRILSTSLKFCRGFVFPHCRFSYAVAYLEPSGTGRPHRQSACKAKPPAAVLFLFRL